MGAIDERVDAASLHLGDELGDGQDQRGRAGDVADEEQARPLGDRGQDRRQASSGLAIGKGIGATTTRAPSRAATARIALIVALYS